MVVPVVTVRNRKAFANISAIIKNFPVAVRKAGDEFGESVVRRLKREVSVQGLIDTGDLHDRITYDRIRAGLGKVRMPLHGVMLDSMRPHYVLAAEGTRIQRWAFRKGNLGVRIKAASNKPIWVRPHPFIKAPIERAIRELPTIIKRHTSRVVHSRGVRT